VLKIHCMYRSNVPWTKFSLITAIMPVKTVKLYANAGTWFFGTRLKSIRKNSMKLAYVCNTDKGNSCKAQDLSSNSSSWIRIRWEVSVHTQWFLKSNQCETEKPGCQRYSTPDSDIPQSLEAGNRPKVVGLYSHYWQFLKNLLQLNKANN